VTGALPWSLSATKRLPLVEGSGASTATTDAWIEAAVVAPPSRWNTTTLHAPSGERISDTRSFVHIERGNHWAASTATRTTAATGNIALPIHFIAIDLPSNGPAAQPPRPAPDFACPERRRGRGRLERRVSRAVTASWRNSGARSAPLGHATVCQSGFTETARNRFLSRSGRKTSPCSSPRRSTSPATPSANCTQIT